MTSERCHRGLPPLADVVLVTGKGGVGKTTIAAGIAEATVRAKGKAVLVEFGDGKSGSRALGRGSKVEHVVIEPQDAIERIATPLFGSAIVAKIVLGNFAMKRLLKAAPGIRELAQLECVRELRNKRRGYRIVVDMPATGHGIAWLRVPAQLRDLIATGPLHDMAATVSRELVSPNVCSVAVVSLPERLVLRETLELCTAMYREVGLTPSRLFVNRVPEPMPDGAMEAAQAIAANPGPAKDAAAELVRILDARHTSRTEAMDALFDARNDLSSLMPTVLPESPIDPSSAEVARWLSASL